MKRDPILRPGAPDVGRERQRLLQGPKPRAAMSDAIADLVGSVDDLRADLSARTKHYLTITRYGAKHSR